MLLGAGFSRRFGEADKRLQLLDGHRTVAECTVERYVSAFDHIRVVLRPEDTRLKSILTRYAVELIDAPDASAGLSQSLRSGTENLSWDMAFIGLLDMPSIRTATLAMLIEAGRQQPDTIHRPRYVQGDDAHAAQHTLGHPIGFPRALYAEFAHLKGDQGAKPVIDAHADRLVEHPTEDQGVVQDIDTPEDLSVIRAAEPPA